MANYPNYNLYGKRPADTYRNIVQFNITASNLVDSYGDDLPLTMSIAGTASWANNSVSASWAPDQTVTVNSASWASQSLSASWAPFTDTGTTLYTGSTYEITSSNAVWASASHDADNANVANYAYNAGTASYLASASFDSASWASQSLSTSWAPSNLTQSSLLLTSPYSTALRVGNSLPIYLSQGWPTIGFNSFYDNGLSSWVYGPGSSNSWAAFENLDVNAGQIEFSFPSASGDSGSSWSPTMVFAISYDGMVKMPLLPDGVLVVSSTNVTSSNRITASLFGTASNAVSASWAPFTQTEQVSASWASASFSTSFVYPLYQEVSMFGPTNVGDTTPYTSLYVVGREGWPARIVQGGSFVTQSARPVLYVYRDLDQSQAQTTPLLQLRTFETGSIAPLMVASNDVSDVFTIDYSGSITASGLFGTASNAVSASWAPTSITYPLTVLTVNEVSYSINFLAGQYFQLDTTGSEFTFGNSTNVTAVRNASVYITPQSGSRTIVFHPSWIVMGNFPTTIAHNSASVLSLTTFGSNDASVVAAFASKV